MSCHCTIRSPAWWSQRCSRNVLSLVALCLVMERWRAAWHKQETWAPHNLNRSGSRSRHKANRSFHGVAVCLCSQQSHANSRPIPYNIILPQCPLLLVISMKAQQRRRKDAAPGFRRRGYVCRCLLQKLNSISLVLPCIGRCLAYIKLIVTSSLVVVLSILLLLSTIYYFLFFVVLYSVDYFCIIKCIYKQQPQNIYLKSETLLNNSDQLPMF